MPEHELVYTNIPWAISTSYGILNENRHNAEVIEMSDVMPVGKVRLIMTRYALTNNTGG